MSYFKHKLFPGLNSKPTKLWNLHQLSRAFDKPTTTIKRYMSYAKIQADVYKPIENRNGHDSAHYSEKSVMEFLQWMSTGVRGERK